MRLKHFTAIALMTVSLAACGRAAPDAGEEAVLVAKPWFFGHGGVEDDPVKAGLSFTAFTTDSIYVNMQPQTRKEHFEDIMSKDGVPLSFDAYVKLKVTDSVSLVKNFSGGQADVDLGEGTVPAWYGANLQGPIRNIVRDAVKKYGLNEVAITYSANAAIEQEVRNGIATYLTKIGMPVQLVDFNLGKANPPDSVQNQRIKTASEQQRQITEQQTTLAEDARKNAEIARAAADNAYREAMQLSPEQFIQLQQINMQQQVCTHSQCTFVSPGTSALVGVSGK